MKISTKTSSLILFMIIGWITGCNDGFLDVKPTDRISSDVIWDNAGLIESYVISTYTTIRLSSKEGHKGRPGFGRGFEYALWSSLTDESVYNNDDQTWLVRRGQISPTNFGFTSTVWGRSYRSIRDVNIGLVNIDRGPLSQDRIKLLKAELRFVRAYRYHDLVRNFGGIPIMGDRVYQLKDDFSELYKRNTIDECIDYIVKELDAAATDLPDGPSSLWEAGRATRGAALALKSRILLYAASPLYSSSNEQGKWQAAAEAALAVIDGSFGYDLYPDYKGLFLKSNTVEDIFERSYIKGGDFHVALELANGVVSQGGWAGNTPIQNLVDDFEMQTTGLPINDPLSGYDVNEPYKGRDPRFYSTILYNQAVYRGDTVQTWFGGGKDAPDITNNNASRTGYYLRKFMDEDIQRIPQSDDGTVSGFQPWKYIRFGEILLNYAEAQNEFAGPDASVYNAINRIRNRSQMPDLPTGLSKDQMRERIKNERRIELCFEEHRYYDVRRWMIADDVENEQVYGAMITRDSDGMFVYNYRVALENILFQEKQYWLPIPQTEIDGSNRVLEQNPGY